MFGVLGGKAAWLPYFDVAGIPPPVAWPLMYAIGIVDVTVGISILIRPTRLALYYPVIWGFWTALLRPLAGEGWWEFLERFPNWIVPLAFLLMSFPRPFYGKSYEQARRMRWVVWCLIIGTFVHYIGHGGYGAVVGKHVWYSYFAAFGFSQAAVDGYQLIRNFGVFEIALGAIVLLHPSRLVVLVAVILMGFDPFARLLAGEPVWEFIERFGNISAPLGLLVVLGRPRALRSLFSPKTATGAVALSNGSAEPWFQPTPPEIRAVRP